MPKKKIYTVATSHLDTVWSWDFETTVSQYIYNTLVDNFKLFEKYPSYKFSFEGSYRYELMEEYYPELFDKMKDYIAKGRWNVCGSAFENGDTNIPSPEALFRNILFGNSYFDEKFGKRSVDIYLPDCFGFGWALPAIERHSNLMGFTTQKLAWGSAYGIPNGRALTQARFMQVLTRTIIITLLQSFVIGILFLISLKKMKSMNLMIHISFTVLVTGAAHLMKRALLLLKKKSRKMMKVILK